MKYNYEPLQGKCKTCLYKCFRVEDPNFKGIWRCKYYKGEEEENENDKSKYT